MQLQTQEVGDGVTHSPARDDVTNQLALASRWSSRSLPFRLHLQLYPFSARALPPGPHGIGRAARVRVRNARKGYKEEEVL